MPSRNRKNQNVFFDFVTFWSKNFGVEKNWCKKSKNFGKKKQKFWCKKSKILV